MQNLSSCGYVCLFLLLIATGCSEKKANNSPPEVMEISEVHLGFAKPDLIAFFERPANGAYTFNDTRLFSDSVDVIGTSTTDPSEVYLLQSPRGLINCVSVTLPEDFTRATASERQQRLHIVNKLLSWFTKNWDEGPEWCKNAVEHAEHGTMLSTVYTHGGGAHGWIEVSVERVEPPGSYRIAFWPNLKYIVRGAAARK